MIDFFRYCLAYKKTIINTVSPVAITSLAPKVLTHEQDLARIRPYLDVLKKTIDDPQITNIALTGGYGSGKSTIIKTFKSHFPQYQYLNISLASFNDIKPEQEVVTDPDNQPVKEKKSALERQLEVSILQQIFYHVEPSEIPDSRFKRIVNITRSKLWISAVGSILWVASTLMLFKLNYINHLNPESWDISKKFDYVAPFPFIIFFIGIGFFAKNFLRLFSNSKISKFTIKGELELGDTSDKSVFNQHLEEILYFFERTKFNVVIIEDLDRFENTDIFTKLREINILLNNSNLIGRDINFVYAIKDEMFTDKSERVKFFEYIIPVIPFINPSNAGDQLAKLITEAHLENVLSKDFTEDVVTFIDDIDMRLLINIFHEYQIYRLNLNEDLNQDELFAVITYKNLFPDDFGELHKRKGKLYQFIDGKAEYIKDLISEIDKQIQKLQEDDSRIESESIKDLQELQRIYISAFFTKFPNASGFIIDGLNRTFGELMEEEIFEKLIAGRPKHRKFTPYYSQFNSEDTDSHITFSEIENEIDQNSTYQERIGFITSTFDGKLHKIKQQIADLRKKRDETEAMSLKQVFEKVDIEPYLKDFKDNLLVRNLLLNGYLNENFNDYISLFHAVNLTQEDNAYLRKVKSGINSPYEYPLTRTENLIKKIAPKYFNRDAVLNFDLMDYMGQNYSVNKKFYDAVIANLSSGTEKSAAFIDAYLEKRMDHHAVFIKSLSRNWKGFWDDINQNRNYLEEKIKWYLILILTHADVNDIISFKGDSNITLYIEKLPNFLKLVQGIKTSKITVVLEKLNIKLTSLQPSEETFRELSDYVYENNHYKINAANIALIIKEKSDTVFQEDLKTQNYTAVMNSGCTALKAYIEENLEYYIKNIMIKLSENSKESQESLVTLINHSGVTTATKRNLINTQEADILEIKDVTTQEMREVLLQENSIAVNWSNILEYFDGLDEKILDDTLLNFLNETANYSILTSSMIKNGSDKGEAFTKSFILLILNCNELTYDAYCALVESTHYSWNSLNFEDLDADKVEYLVHNRDLNLTESNYNKLREHYLVNYFHLLLIENNEKVFTDNIQIYSIDNTEIRKLLNSSKLTNTAKIKIIQHIGEAVIIENPSIGKLVCRTLAFSPFIPISHALLQSLFAGDSSIENKIRVLNKQVSSLIPVQIKDLVSSLDTDYAEIFILRHKPKFTANEYNNELFSILEKNNLIKGYDIDNKDQSKFKVVAKYQ